MSGVVVTSAKIHECCVKCTFMCRFKYLHRMGTHAMKSNSDFASVYNIVNS